MPTYRTSRDGPGPRWLWSRSCRGGRHADCGHFLSLGCGVGVRPQVVLCLCGCHSGCPLAGGLPVAREVWQARCTCPGIDLAAGMIDEAEWEEIPDPANFERQWQERRASSERESQQRRVARRDAFDAARAAATGKTRAEVRNIYVAELQARGLTIPPDLVLDAYADAMARNSDKISAVYSVRVLAEMGRDAGKLLWRLGRDL
jgi:hypothetical protein